MKKKLYRICLFTLHTLLTLIFLDILFIAVFFRSVNLEPFRYMGF